LREDVLNYIKLLIIIFYIILSLSNCIVELKFDFKLYKVHIVIHIVIILCKIYAANFMCKQDGVSATPVALRTCTTFVKVRNGERNYMIVAICNVIRNQ